MTSELPARRDVGFGGLSGAHTATGCTLGHFRAQSDNFIASFNQGDECYPIDGSTLELSHTLVPRPSHTACSHRPQARWSHWKQASEFPLNPMDIRRSSLIARPGMDSGGDLKLLVGAKKG
ncbi:hypothetical protein CERZMDRAFT_97991 [Cercospora zeae-maydis SCOH1-5]|uniref:Uncharacterized protein n=1 Tax=Cercospora zeae-maydis SCOH1-5 TaxID=717836 RepID=A0A6A6FF77_9PEZI|nr:hypothetical protein CERZMDRAFT_97991 [Cercospora zeae-maydis SCOH1-5]